MREEANALVSIIGTIVRNRRANVALKSKKRGKRAFVKVIPDS